MSSDEWDYEDGKVIEPTEPEDGLYETIMKLSDDTLNRIRAEAIEQDIDEIDVIEHWVRNNRDGFFMGEIDIEESVVTLKHIDPWGELDTNVASSGASDARKANRKVYRRLRDTFPPVKAGIEYAKSFTSGGGFTVDIDNVNSKLEQQNRQIVNALNRNIYQDEIVRGLSPLLDTMMDDTFTVGSSGAEIVYDNEIDDDKLIVGQVPITDFPLDTPNIPEFETRDPNDKEWKKLGGVAQLKIIDDAIERLKPYRNPTTYRIEYWTVDEERTNKLNEERKSSKLAPVTPRKLMPYQVLWLPWSVRGTDITGHSIVEGVASIALLLENILGAVGISFRKWSDKKYFFILGNTDGRTWAPPKVRNFLQDVKRMTTQNGTGIAVPAGFDIKEIGGEIFEGGQIIDNLLTLICTGMTYPKTFLTQGAGAEGDQAWMAWIRTYSNYQNLITTNVEHQLWARHLYCKLGTTQEVAKQGVSKDSRQRIPTYVPIMSWRSDGKWQTHTKIEQQTKVLNVANPIDPALKLQIEKDIAITLGFTEMDWKPAEQILQQQQQLLLLDSTVEHLRVSMLVEALQKAKDEGLHLEMKPQLPGLSSPKPVAPEPEPEDEIDDLDGEGEDDDMDEPETKGKKEKRPPPVPGKRLEGGVSRATADRDSRKGQSKPQGGSRRANPRKVQESELISNELSLVKVLENNINQLIRDYEMQIEGIMYESEEDEE